MLYLQGIIFLILSIYIGSFIKRGFFRKCFLILASYIFTLDLMAILSKGSHLNYEFIANIDLSIVELALKNFKLQLSLFFMVIFFWTFVIFKYESFLYSHLKLKFRKIITITLLAISFLPNGVGYTFFSTLIFDLMPQRIETPEKVLADLGIEKKFIYGKNIKATPGKNVVFIYLESLEKGFLDNTLFNNLTPNLNRLKNEWSFYDNYKSLYGSTWTMGALYATQTGLPTIFGLQGNNIFNNICELEVPSIGAILKKAGYNQIFIKGADLNFSGVGNFFRYQGYKAFGDKELSKTYPRSSWGVKDKDVFEEAKKWYLKLSKENKPFNLTVLTVDTHFPDGIFDDRFKNMFPNDKGIEYSVKATDYLVGDFIDFLKKQPNFKDTVVYILPDHCIMGDESVTPCTKILNKKERGLFLITNAPKKDILGDLTFYDLPRIFLNGMQVTTNVKFFKELLPNFDIENKHKTLKLKNLNLALNHFKSIKNNIEIKVLKNNIDLYIDNELFDRFTLNSENKKYFPLDDDGNIRGNFLVEKEVVTPGMDLSKCKNKIEIMLNEKGEPYIYYLRKNKLKIVKKKIEIKEILQ